MTDADLNHEMELKLLEMKRDILARLADRSDESKNITGNKSINDSIDDAQDEIALKKLEAVSKLDANKLRAIQNALDRIRSGRYGYCLKCGKRIPEERLRALPYAVLCLDCKTAEEGYHR